MLSQGRDAARRRVIFLPGATGDGGFWRNVGNRLPAVWDAHYLSWPGLGNQPAHPEVAGIDDLTVLAAKSLQEPSAIVAQSMGGLIALQLALRTPELVSHLVLVATSGGIDVAAHGGIDWRPDFLAAFPKTAKWILTEKPDLTRQLAQLKIPTLLLWGDDDPISPVAVGKYLLQQISSARLEVIAGGRHALGFDLPEVVAPLVCAHLNETP